MGKATFSMSLSQGVLLCNQYKLRDDAFQLLGLDKRDGTKLLPPHLLTLGTKPHPGWLLAREMHT